MEFPISPQTILEFKLFKEELHALLDNVLDQAETLQTTAEEPVVLDRDWIIGTLKDQITTEKYVIKPGAVQVTEGLGNLLKIPRELRDLIYGYAIVGGQTAIVRASKQTHKEASELIFQNGIYRLVIGFGDDIINPPLSQSLAKNIKNLILRVNGRGFFIDGVDEDLPILHMFDGSNIQRKDCVVTVVCDPFCGEMDAFQVVRALDNLTGFERVILELDLEWWGEPWPDTIDETQEYRIWARINGAVHHQKKLLRILHQAPTRVCDKLRVQSMCALTRCLAVGLHPWNVEWGVIPEHS